MGSYLLKWPPELESAAREAARSEGVTLADYIRQAVIAKIIGREPDHLIQRAEAAASSLRAKARQVAQERRTECCGALVVAGRCGLCRQPVR